MRNETVVPAARPRVAIGTRCLKLAVPHAEALQLEGDGLPERAAAARRASASRSASSDVRRSASPRACSASASGSTPASCASSSAPRRFRAGEQLLVARGPEAPPGVGDPLELAFDLLEAAGLGLERREEAAQSRGDLA